MRNQWLKPALLLAMSLNLPTAFAADEHQHAGDIQPWLENGQIKLNATLFEANFGDLAGGLYSTDDPGFDADNDHGAFSAGNWLNFQGLSSLKFWNGSSWSNAVPNGEYVKIEDALGNTTKLSVSGVDNAAGVIGDFDAAGDIHTHLDFTIYNSSDVKGGSVGAYWITLSLFESAPFSSIPLASSENFSIIFNRGLTEVAYESAVSAVPVPAAFWMFGSAFLGWLSVVRGRKSLNA
jgi:hypothetical protein